MSPMTNCAKDSLRMVIEAFFGTSKVPPPDNWSAKIRTRPAAALTRSMVTVSISGVIGTIVVTPSTVTSSARPCASRSSSMRAICAL